MLLHNKHRSGAPSGDDIVVSREIELLRKNGHEVCFYGKYNDAIDKWSLFRKIRLFFEIPWSTTAQKELTTILEEQKYDIVHIHNIFPQFSISIYETLKRFNLPFVHTLHDFRLFCANAFLFRNGRVCELCPTKHYLYSVKYRCFQNSLLKSIPSAFMIKYSKKNENTLHPDYYIVLTEFAKSKIVDFGINPRRIFIKPNFISEQLSSSKETLNYAAFVGRLSKEKGIDIILKSLQAKKCKKIPIKVIGDGPLSVYVEQKIKEFGLKQIDILGLKSHRETIEYIKKARFLIMPSLCYESFPVTLIEAMAMGTPVIATNIGALGYLIRNHETGILTSPGDVEDLANKITWLWEHDEERKKMGENARKEFEEKYTPEKNFKILMNIYEKAIEMHRKGR